MTSLSFHLKIYITMNVHICKILLMKQPFIPNFYLLNLGVGRDSDSRLGDFYPKHLTNITKFMM